MVCLCKDNCRHKVFRLQWKCIGPHLWPRQRCTLHTFQLSRLSSHKLLCFTSCKVIFLRTQLKSWCWDLLLGSICINHILKFRGSLEEGYLRLVELKPKSEYRLSYVLVRSEGQWSDRHADQAEEVHENQPFSQVPVLNSRLCRLSSLVISRSCFSAVFCFSASSLSNHSRPPLWNTLAPLWEKCPMFHER